jgi:biotin transport system substrate-specific component
MAERGWDRTPPRTVVTMVAGNLVIYAFGLPFLMATLDVGLAKGLELGVTPFLAGDALKILLAAGLLPGAWALVGRDPEGSGEPQGVPR